MVARGLTLTADLNFKNKPLSEVFVKTSPGAPRPWQSLSLEIFGSKATQAKALPDVTRVGGPILGAEEGRKTSK